MTIPARLAWRAPLLGGCLLVALLTTIWVLNITVLGIWAALPLTLQPSDRLLSLVVTDVAPSSAHSGVLVGDQIDLRDYAFGERFAIYSGYAPLGHRFDLQLHRGRLVHHATVVAYSTPGVTWGFWFVIFSCYWGILLAALISWRRPDIPVARFLVVYILTFTAGIVLQPFNLVTPSLNLNAVIGELNTAVIVFNNALPAAVFVLFAPPLSRGRRFWTAATYVLATAVFLRASLIFLDIAIFRFNPVINQGLVAWPVWDYVGYTPIMGSVVCAVLAVRASRGIDRQRAAWVAVVIFSTWISDVFLDIAAFLPNSGLISTILFYVGDATSILTPLGLSYAVLKRRIVDIGFVLNRAAVFTIVSLVLLALFVCGEWALSEWFAATHRATSSGASVALVLVLGICMRSIHRRVDQLVGGVLFRKRHQNETALRVFGTESAFIKTLEDLERRTISTVKEHTGASEATLFLADQKQQTYAPALQDGASSKVQASDNAIVEMTQSRKAVDLRKTATGLVGEYAFPMFARGRLIGALICGSKPDGDVYAPDERAALAELARGVGLAIATLS